MITGHVVKRNRIRVLVLVWPAFLLGVPLTNVIGQDLNSTGSMTGGTLGRTRVWDSASVDPPHGMIWTSKKLFVIKDELTFSSQGISGSFDSGQSFSESIAAAGLLFFNVASEHGTLFAISLKDGKEAWRLRQNDFSFYSDPTAAGGSLFVGDAGGNFYSLEIKSGKEQWRFKAKGRNFAFTSPAISGGLVYFNSGERYEVNGSNNVNSDEYVYAVSTTDGTQKWQFKGDGILTSPAIANDLLFVSSKNGLLYAINRISGAEIWKTSLKRPLDAPAYSSESVYVVDSDGTLYCLNAKDGALRWQSGKNGRLGGSLAINGNLLYAGSKENSVVALDPLTGNEKWRYQTKVPCRSPVVADKVVYITCSDKVLYALDTATGAERWKYKNPTGTINAPVLANGAMYFVDHDGFAYAIH